MKNGKKKMYHSERKEEGDDSSGTVIPKTSI